MKAHTPEEVNEVKELIRKVNIEELGKTYLLDKASYGEVTYLYAQRDEKVIAALRCEIGSYSSIHSEYWSIPKMSFNANIAFVDRLVVSRDFRKSRAMISLAKSIYELGILSGVHFCLIESDEQLLKIYERLGFQVYQQRNYLYGSRWQMYLNLWDVEHLINCKSTFLDEYDSYLKVVKGSIQMVSVLVNQ